MRDGEAAGASKADLSDYLDRAQRSLIWKIDGLDDYDLRRPMTRTGTNLLGLVKHVGSMAALYFGDVFGRPRPQVSWLAEDALDGADLYALGSESRELIIGFWDEAWAVADATIEALALEDLGHVAWWSEQRREPSLHRILVHMISETERHAGHADILRELIDGSVGIQPEDGNLAGPDSDEHWLAYRQQLEGIARGDAGHAG